VPIACAATTADHPVVRKLTAKNTLTSSTQSLVNTLMPRIMRK
jgi:hypothetical protein